MEHTEQTEVNYNSGTNSAHRARIFPQKLKKNQETKAKKHNSRQNIVGVTLLLRQRTGFIVDLDICINVGPKFLFCVDVDEIRKFACRDIVEARWCELARAFNNKNLQHV